MRQRGSPDQTLGHAFSASASGFFLFLFFHLVWFLCSVFKELQAESLMCRIQKFHIKIWFSGFSQDVGL